MRGRLTRPFPAPLTVFPTPPVAPLTVPEISPLPIADVVSVTVDFNPPVVLPSVLFRFLVAVVPVLPTLSVTCLTGLPTPMFLGQFLLPLSSMFWLLTSGQLICSLA
jgi:hypothetical protein